MMRILGLGGRNSSTGDVKRVAPAGSSEESLGSSEEHIFPVIKPTRSSCRAENSSCGAENDVLPTASGGGGLRKSCEGLLSHLQNREHGCLIMQPGEKISKKNVKPEIVVVRGPDWNHGDEDGGAGQPGIILTVDNKAKTMTVHWQDSGRVEAHYRFSKADLCIATVEGAPIPPAGGSMISKSITAVTAPFKKGRNSQAQFADKSQTIIVFDWDDTLFPSTYVRSDLHLSLRLPLKDQRIPPDLKKEVASYLQKSAQNADQLLRLASSYGRGVLVTLARNPWVMDSCRYFYPGIGELIQKLGIKIVYAQEGQQVDYDKVKMMSDDATEEFYSSMKGRAIGGEVKDFYSQYEGQTWKNVISIGDSNFERLGTLKATEEYMKDHGYTVPEDSGNSAMAPRSSMADIGGHVFHVRTKVFKMIDEPTIEELTIETEMVRQWLPYMVRLDSGFDVDLSSLDEEDAIKEIEETLRGK